MDDEVIILVPRLKLRTVLLSYVVSVTGAMAAITVNMQRGMTTSKKKRAVQLFVVALSIGLISIWSMHFVGMDAFELVAPDGTVLVIDYDGPLTFVSLFAGISTVYIGLKFVSQDIYFREVLKSKRAEAVKQSVQKRVSKSKNGSSLSKKALASKPQIYVLLSNLHRIFIAGFFIGAGVCVMHYVGMVAQCFDAEMSFSPGLVVLSAVIAVAAAAAGSFIMFRLLTFYDLWMLRMASAFVIGIAVCTMHYTGMYAATYTYRPGLHAQCSQRFFAISGPDMTAIVTYGSLLARSAVDAWVRSDLWTLLKGTDVEKAIMRQRETSVGASESRDIDGSQAPLRAGAQLAASQTQTIPEKSADEPEDDQEMADNRA